MPRTNLRLVLDTNVYFSAFAYPKSVPDRVWQQAAARRFVLLISPPILREVARVLREHLDWEEDKIVEHLKLLTRVAQVVSPSITVAVFTGTMEADNRILECAVAGKADLIVSGDLDLQRLKVYKSIPILRPVDALRTLGGK